jgi:hypothetical protein
MHDSPAHAREHHSANNAGIRRATVEQDRTTQAPSQMHCQTPIMSYIPSRNANPRHLLARIASLSPHNPRLTAAPALNDLT